MARQELRWRGVERSEVYRRGSAEAEMCECPKCMNLFVPMTSACVAGIDPSCWPSKPRFIGAFGYLTGSNMH
jgi:hypothetical protein